VLVPGTVEEGAESDDGAEHEHADEHREPVAEGCGPGAAPWTAIAHFDPKYRQLYI
jgi:hypothetical protein